MPKAILHTLLEASRDGLITAPPTVDRYKSFRLMTKECIGKPLGYQYALIAAPTKLLGPEKHYAQSAGVWLDNEKDRAGHRGAYFDLFQAADIERAKRLFRQDVDAWYQLNLTTPKRERKGGELEL